MTERLSRRLTITAYVTVSIPTRPRYIIAMSINFEPISSVGVMPSVIPTVPDAEATSLNRLVHLQNVSRMSL